VVQIFSARNVFQGTVPTTWIMNNLKFMSLLEQWSSEVYSWFMPAVFSDDDRFLK
jgi:hypothetical protein